MFTGQASVASSIRARFHAPGVTVVALVPSAGPVPPPISVVMPPPSASGSCVGEIMCTWQSMPPAVRISPLPAMISVDGPITRSGWTPSMMSGLPGLADRDDPAVADADVGLDDAPVVEDDRAGDDQVGRALGAGRERLAHRLADHLAAAEHRLVAARAQVLLDLDEQRGVGQPDPVARGGAVQQRVPLAAQLAHWHSSPDWPPSDWPLGLPASPVRRTAGRRSAGLAPRAARRAAPATPRARRRARTAPRCRPGRSAGDPRRGPGRTAAPRWPARSGSATRPGPAGRRCWRRRASAPAAPRSA